MSNRKPLKKGKILNQKYVIDNLISDAGATCLVYKVHPITKEGNVDLLNPLIIKEFYPQNWVMISRNVETGQLDLRLAVLQHAFQREVENFCAQAEYNNLSGYDGDNDARYASFLHMDTFEENQTGYIVVSSISGATLETPTALLDFPIAQHTNREKEAVVSLIDLILRITDAVEVQHQAGFLNGDIKPDNLLVSSVGESVLVHLLDFGSCIPTDKEQLRLITPAILRLRLSQSAHYSSERLSSIYNYIKQKSQGDDETELYNLLSKLSPADDVYSICRVFGEMLFGKTDFDAHKEINDLQWLNNAEKACLCNLFLNGMNVEMETTAKDLRHMLKHLRQVLKREGTSKERFWASSLDYYEAHKDSRIFCTTYKIIQPSEHMMQYRESTPAIKGSLNGGAAMEMKDLLRHIEDESVYIHDAYGSDKPFLVAALSTDLLKTGRKTVFWLDLKEVSRFEKKILPEDTIIRLLIQTYLLANDIKGLEMELLKEGTSREFILVLDNLDAVEEDQQDELFRQLLRFQELYHNTQLIVLGKNRLEQPLTANTIKLLGEPKIEYDMRDVQFFANCGKEMTVFSVDHNDTKSVVCHVNFEKTRIREEIPAYAGAYYLQIPSIDVRDYSLIQFEASSPDQGIKEIQVEIKPKGKEWRHEIFRVSLTDSIETFSLEIDAFKDVRTKVYFEEVTFVVFPDSFTDMENLQGCLQIQNLRIK